MVTQLAVTLRRPMSVERESEHAFTRSSLDRSYWLSRCEGFRVDAADGRIGFVEEVVFSSKLDEPDALVVRAGLFGRRTILISAHDVAEVVPREKRLRLRGRPTPL